MLDCSYGLIAQLGERSVRIRKVEGSTPLRVHKTPYCVKRYGVSFCRSLQNRASFVLTAQSDVCRTFRHNVHSFTRSFVKNDDSPIRSTQPPNGCLFKVRFPPTRSTHRERMTLKFFKLLQRNIEDDLNIIIPFNTDFLDGVLIIRAEPEQKFHLQRLRKNILPVGCVCSFLPLLQNRKD